MVCPNCKVDHTEYVGGSDNWPGVGADESKCLRCGAVFKKKTMKIIRVDGPGTIRLRDIQERQ